MINLKKIKQIILVKKTPVFILLAILPLAYLFLIFYFYVYVGKTQAPEQNKKIFIDHNLYEKIMEDFRQREINFTKEPNKTYIDPFSR